MDQTRRLRQASSAASSSYAFQHAAVKIPISSSSSFVSEDPSTLRSHHSLFLRRWGGPGCSRVLAFVHRFHRCNRCSLFGRIILCFCVGGGPGFLSVLALRSQIPSVQPLQPLRPSGRDCSTTLTHTPAAATTREPAGRWYTKAASATSNSAAIGSNSTIAWSFSSFRSRRLAQLIS